jgi:exodeoxyribonuclease VIII
MTLREQPVLNQIMLDLETLATDHDAVIVSIGAVRWNKTTIGDTFYAVLNLDDQILAGRKMKDVTVAWWSQQSEAARSVFDSPRQDTDAALKSFAEWLGEGNLQIWGNGSDFDNAILGSAYASFGIKRPWSYGNNRCYRTLKNIAHPGENLPARVGTHHNAVDDAIYQAQCAQAYLKGTLR